MERLHGVFLPAALVAASLMASAQDAPPQNASVKELRTTFDVRYIATGAVYVSGGRDEGLMEGFHLNVKRVKPGEPVLSAQQIARLVVTGVTAHSAVCEIESATLEPEPGDIAQISKEDLETIQAVQQSATARRYAQVVTFTEGDALDQELRDYVPKPPSPEVNRVRGRISYEFNAVRDQTASMLTTQHGIVLRIDANRLGGTYWNFTGYWRGRINTHGGDSAQTVTIRDLVNRTYHIGLFYNSPESHYMLGFGRMYVPWITSLGTIDGGYVARKLSRRARVGMFAGSTPDPTAWNYKPNRQIAGTFLNFEVGRFENVRFDTTMGVALTRLSWKAERQFAFSQSSFSWKQLISVYQNLEADQLVAGRLGSPDSGAVMSRSFTTLRIQPRQWLSLDFNHNYFRTIPTFDLVLVGTGLLDRFLFAGLSAGARVDLPHRVTVYGSLGQNKRNDDTRKSINQMYGITFRDVFDTKVRMDVRRSIFHGAFGDGWYQSVNFSRELGDRLRMELGGGQQEFHSLVSESNRGFFMNSTVDWFLGRHYTLGGGINLFRGKTQNYDQTYFSVGYRF